MSDHATHTERACGSWPSPLSADAIVAGGRAFADAQVDGDSLYVLEARPDEGGRVTLLKISANAVDQPVAADLTPNLNIRSRVHEYGGGAMRVQNGVIWLVNMADQNIYRVDGTGRATQLTHTDSGRRYADFAIDQTRNRLIAVCEQHRDSGETENLLTAVDLDSGAETTLASGRDFFACPRLSPDGRKLAYVAWDHPNMPWDGSELMVCGFADDGGVSASTVVAGGAAESIVEPMWLDDGTLLFNSDRTGYWNLWRYDASGVDCVLNDTAEYAKPPWQFDVRCVVPLDNRYVAAERCENGVRELVLIDTEGGFYTPVHDAFESYTHLGVSQGRIVALVGRGDAAGGLALITANGSVEQLREEARPALEPNAISPAEQIRFPARDGGQAFAWVYPPCSGKYAVPADEKPPLMVLSHGGPTAAASTSLNYRIQYFTSRGWMVVDVDYGGSTGYGRAYRDRLRDQWGIVDVADCEDAARHLVASGRADPTRIAIRGGSAGGYTTLAALCFTSTFRAGASYYGIGDLRALIADTHKFEARYCDGLLNGEFDARSPIHHSERLNCPVVFFQGSEDKVVPPNQAESMIKSLRARDIDVAYVLFDGEGHGFRDGINIKRSIETEYAFFAHVFGFAAPDQLPAIPWVQGDGVAS